MKNRRIIVIGAGASGMMAAGRAAENGAEVLLLEKMDQPGKKILISGKTRCNLSNARNLDAFIEVYGGNGQFLYGAFGRFFREELLALMKNYGVETKTERGGRIFPASDDARDVVEALKRYLFDHGVQLKTGVKVTGIRFEEGKVKSVQTENGSFVAGAVVVATGGSSYPITGSSGDGYRISESAGHTIIKLRPALVPLVVEEKELAAIMQGVSLRNVRLTAFAGRAENIGCPTNKKMTIESRIGEMMLTHFGIGGPITLQMSLKIVDALETSSVSVSIDMKPALEIKQLRQRLQRDFDSFSKRSFHNILKELLPHKMIEPFVKLTGISPWKQANQITAEERNGVADLLKSLRFNITGPLPLSAAMVTAGGVSLKEIDPKTMASKLVKGLYFSGEVMDIQADTGGYNLQAAFSTGYLAGESAAKFVLDG